MDQVPILPSGADVEEVAQSYLMIGSFSPLSLPPGRRHDPDFDRLVQGFIFSRWFIITYQAAVVGVILLVTIWKQWERYRRLRRGKATGKVKRTDVRDVERGSSKKQRKCKSDVVVKSKDNVSSSSESSSSSSSVRAGNVSPVEGDDTTKESEAERARLLSSAEPYGDDSDEAVPSPSCVSAPWRWLQYALMYQPAPLPIVHRVLPPNITSLWILALFGLNCFYLFFKIGWHGRTQSVIADRAGLLFTANLPWLYLLAAKNQPIKAFTGSSYENLNMLHRRLGEWMCFLAAFHLAGMLLSWYDFLRPVGVTLWHFLTVRYILWGCGAWICYEVLYFSSLSSFREWWYEVFLGSHVALQTLGLVSLWLHHYQSKPYVAASLAIFVLDRFMWRLGIKTCSLQAELKVMEDRETVMVSADWPILPRKKLWWRHVFGWDMRFGWKSSEHVFITVPGMSMKHKLQFHPITIASAAPDLDKEQTHAWFNLIIRAKSGFSRDLLYYAQERVNARIRLDGPYGSLHALEMFHASDVAILVAGGSGIAVAYPMLWSLLHRKSWNKGSELDGRRQDICLIWIVQEASHVSWIGRERLDELVELGLHLIVPSASRQYGRPDVKALLNDQIERFVESTEDKVGVIVSGPDSLNRTVQNTCAQLVLKGLDVESAVEKFGW